MNFQPGFARQQGMNYMRRNTRFLAAACIGGLLFAGSASADPLATPAVAATLSGNSNPFKVQAGPFGDVYVSGVITGLGMVQNNHSDFDRSNLADLSNGQLFVQTTSGPIQFFLDVGLYSLPALGTPYTHATTLTGETYSGVPMAYVKLQPTSEFSIEVGKLPTLIGAEAAYTFQNVNIVRGLLWNEEPVVSDGVQINYAKGPLSLSVSLNDGFYSNRYNWLSGLASYAVTKTDTLAVAGGGAMSKYDRSTAATPLFQNNSVILDVMWTHTQGSWMVEPYFQYTHATSVEAGGLQYAGGSTWSGAVLAKYSFNAHWSVGGRVEYIASSSADCPLASTTCVQTNLLYGPGSKAVSVTLTPTWQQGAFFVRGEAAYLSISDATPGAALGQFGEATSQWRGAIETGFLF